VRLVSGRPRLDHLGVEATGARFALLTGDPGRVPVIAGRFESARELTARRGFVVWEARRGAGPLLVVCTGIGAPATAIVVEELAELGVRAMVRVGTCGALQPEVRVGDLVIPAGCVRDEGTSRQYVPLEFPALADPLLLGELAAGAAALGARHHVGVTHAKDAYYSERPDGQADPHAARRRWETWRRAGVLATDMECSALFVVGLLCGVRAGAVLVNVGAVTPPDLFAASLGAAVEIAVRAADVVLAAAPLPARRGRGEDASFLEDTPR
jgi:uridine phosphorylase